MFRSSLLAFLIKVVSSLGMLLINIVVAQRLGSYLSGYFFLLQAICLFVSNISRQGFDYSLIRFIAAYNAIGDYDKIGQYFSYSFIRIIFLSALLSFIIFIFSVDINNLLFDKEGFSHFLDIGMLSIIPMAISSFIGFCFQGLKKTNSAMFYQQSLLTLLFLFVLFFCNDLNLEDTIYLYSICAISTALLAISHWFYSVKNKLILNFCDDTKLWKCSYRPLFLVMLFSQVNQWLPQILVGSFCDITSVSLFSASQRTAMITSFVLVAVNAVVSPRFSEAYKDKDFVRLKKLSSKSSKLMVYTSVPIIIFIMFFPDLILSAFGDDFIDGKNILRILALGQFVNVITGSVGYLLQMTGNESVVRNNMMMSCFIIVLTSFILIPLYGAIGAAIASALSMSLQNLLCVYKVKKIFGFNTLIFWSR